MSSARSAPLYDNIGVHYDSTRRADPHLTERLAHNLALRPGGRYLDIACGTGNYTHSLAEKGGDWYGVDVSSGMLRRAQAKGGQCGVSVGGRGSPALQGWELRRGNLHHGPAPSAQARTGVFRNPAIAARGQAGDVHFNS